MAENQVSPEKETLFHQERPGGLSYRIPALIYLPSESAFLAFAEERSSPRDEDAEFLVMRRGLRKCTSVQWGPQESLKVAMLPNHRTMNPCPVYERKSGKIFLFFICVETHISEGHQIRTGRNAARLCHVVSQDGGRTWSQMTDLTEPVIGDDLRNWATFAVGPGHGLQLSSGRLVIPAYTYYIHKSCSCCYCFCCTKPHCFTLYSDDAGKHWARGQLLKSLEATECQVAEVTCHYNSHVLYLNARNQRWDRCRVEAFSEDGGVQFEHSHLCKKLCEPPGGCQGSVVSFCPATEPLEPGRKEQRGESSPLLGIRPHSASSNNTKSWLVYSHPTFRSKRRDLGIYLNASPLEKGSWQPPWVLHKGPSGYSDLAVCEEGKSVSFGCLFECGVSYECEEIAFQLFTEAELLRNVVEGCALKRSSGILRPQ